MALIFTKRSASQNSIKYSMTGTGATDLARATILADCPAGPLKNYLTGLSTGALWAAAWPGAAADPTSSKLSVNLQAQAAGAGDPSVLFAATGSGVITVQQAAEVACVLEIRFNQTPDQ